MVRDQLENHYNKHRGNRDPQDANLFDYIIRAVDSEGNCHTLRFSIDDSIATG
jgi:hypothetical protein